MPDCHAATAQIRSDEASLTGPTRFLARQPILNLSSQVIGYELLFRSGWENFFRGEADDATLQMLDNCIMMGVDNLTQHTLAFVNCTRAALVERLVTILPPATTVLEILETIEPDDEVRAACLELKSLGYRLALDDFRPDSALCALAGDADYLKVDFRLSGPDERKRIAKIASKTNAVLLAEKIESQQEFDDARREKYQLFQGYFFCRPSILAERDLPANWSNYMRLVSALNRETLALSEIAPIVEAEASLCYRLLRLANSAAIPTRSQITSVTSAVMMVGEARFRTLASLALAAALGADQPKVLLQISLERAHFCQRIASLLGEDPNEQYLLGLLSLIGAMLHSPMEKLVHALPLREEAKNVLLGVDCPIARALRLIIALESGDWEPISETAEHLHISEARIAGIYIDSLRWANVQMQQLAC
ncbi:EAL and HDOD domain-containing protein [Silvibacterium sp.]|uniref:EAL and HDOD domain-containing protein n=1 Tax=Silvibacterium sp. TaxID=1964179 RepID=UPI0039E26FCD